MPIPGFGTKQQPGTSLRGEIDALLGQLRNYWGSLDDTGKQELVNSIGEMVGGTGGAMLGGGTPMSIPFAGAGAVTGRQAGKVIGQLAGLKPKETSMGEEALETGKTLVSGMAGEGVGRAIPVVAKSVKAAAGNLIRKPFQPNEATKAMTALADKYGIPLNIAQRSGKVVLGYVQGGLDRWPFASGVMRDAYEKQYNAWLKAMNRTLGLAGEGKMSQERFAEVAEQSMRTLRNKFDRQMKMATESAGASIHPEAVSLQGGGEALKGGHAKNLEDVSKWAKKAYGDVEAAGVDAQVDLTPFSEQAQAALGEIPEALQSQIFPGKTLARLRSGVAMRPQPNAAAAEMQESVSQGLAGKPFADLTDAERTQVRGVIARIDPEASVEDVPQAVSMKDAMSLRSQLLDARRRLDWRDNANEIRSLDALIEGLDESMEKSLEGTDALKLLKSTNATYRKKMQALKPPLAEGKPGNVAAGKIYAEKLPERLPKQIAQSPTLLEGTRTAVSPETVADIGGVGKPEALPMFERSIFDDAVASSTTAEGRVSPSMLSRNLPGAAGVVTGSRAASVKGLAGPRLLAREEELYASPLATAVDKRAPNEIMGAAFPRAFPPRAKQTLKTLGETGTDAEGRQALGQHLMDLSRTESKALADQRFVNPRTFEKVLEGYGETLPAVFGPGAARRAAELAGVGRAVTRDEVFNTSGTAKAMEALKFIGSWGAALASPLTIPETLGATVAVPYTAAKMFSSPKLAKWLTQPPKPIRVPMGGAGWGAAGRAALTLPGAIQPGQQTPGAEPINFVPDEPERINFIPD